MVQEDHRPIDPSLTGGARPERSQELDDLLKETLIDHDRYEIGKCSYTVGNDFVHPNYIDKKLDAAKHIKEIVKRLDDNRSRIAMSGFFTYNGPLLEKLVGKKPKISLTVEDVGAIFNFGLMNKEYLSDEEILSIGTSERLERSNQHRKRLLELALDNPNEKISAAIFLNPFALARSAVVTIMEAEHGSRHGGDPILPPESLIESAYKMRVKQFTNRDWDALARAE